MSTTRASSCPFVITDQLEKIYASDGENLVRATPCHARDATTTTKAKSVHFTFLAAREPSML